MRDAGHFVIPDDDPCLPGHFPGRPLVPGVVLLDAALSLILTAMPPCRLAGLAMVKFSAIVPPGRRVDVRRAEVESIPGRLEFTCFVDGKIVASGAALLSGPST
jgi:3-hydroxymyristoyl/3-hydroxydecanoyl-(acyl carrier protein) dehydratase